MKSDLYLLFLSGLSAGYWIALAGFPIIPMSLILCIMFIMACFVKT